MIDQLLSIIKTQVLSKNSYLNKFSVNCIENAEGQIVADYNRGEVYEGAEDIYGMGGYVRYTDSIQYSEAKKTTSNNKGRLTSVPLRLVVYNFNEDKEVDTVRLEEKISNDLDGVDFSSHTGAETQIEIVFDSADLNASRNWDREIQKPRKEANSFYQMISIDFNLKFVRTQMDEECFVDCYVFNNADKC